MHLLLSPGFSQLTLSSFVDPLRCANLLAKERSFDWRILEADGKPVVSSSGMTMEVDGSLDIWDAGGEHAALVLIGGDHIEQQTSPRLNAFLRNQSRRNVPIYALGTATWLLAEAGLLHSGARCTIHWSKLAALSEKYRDLVAEDVLFVRHGNLTTCAGEFAAFDLAVEIIEHRLGGDMARFVCEQLTADRRRAGGSWQSIPPGLRYVGAAAKVIQIAKLMERNLEEPLSLEDLARRVSLSRRQVERLFEKHLNTTPLQHYLSLRLRKARQLLEMTSMPVVDVAVACGFVSSSHFAKCFKDHFRLPPSKTRATFVELARRSAA
ncbi:hypothetical protein ASD12_26135 [Mesorhizobium sp. Root102]|nr:hypothetical protein ASD12_26135 [Mesorhizobium sp. Root102]